MVVGAKRCTKWLLSLAGTETVSSNHGKGDKGNLSAHPGLETLREAGENVSLQDTTDISRNESWHDSWSGKRII